MKKFASAVVIFGAGGGNRRCSARVRGRLWRTAASGGNHEESRTPREITQHGNETPTWTNAPDF